MKKLILFLSFVFAGLCGFAKNVDFIPNYNNEYSNDTLYLTPSISACNMSTKIISGLPLWDSCSSLSYSFCGIHYHSTGPFVELFIDVPNDTILFCYIDSINGIPLDVVQALPISVRHAPTFTIPLDSIKHVTCPDGLYSPYADGKFSVLFNDSLQDYLFVRVESNITYFATQTYYDDFTLSQLRAGTYQITAWGANGCQYHDSVVITQPEPWVDNIEEDIIDTIRCNEPAHVKLALTGGTLPYTFNWRYEFDSTLVIPDTNEFYVSSPGIYYSFFHDARGCLFNGFELAFIVVYEFVVDTIHLESADTIICPGEELMLSAFSQSFGNYTWSVGDYCDSINSYPSIYYGNGYVSEYYVDTLTESQYIKVSFTDKNGCVTHDSIWIDVNHPDVDLVNTPDNLCINGDYPLDLSAYTVTTPTGGSLYYYGAAGLTGNGLFSPASAGSYEIHAIYTDSDGCTAQDSATIHVMDPEPIVLTVDTLMFTDSLYYIQAPAGGTMLLGETLLTETNEGYILDASQYEPGYYTLHYEVVLGEYNCLSEYETVIHIINSTKVRDFGQEISIYPNPAITTLNLSSTEQMDFTATITDVTGKVICTENILGAQHTINVSDMSPGIYLLRLKTTAGATKTVKFVKK